MKFKLENEIKEEVIKEIEEELRRIITHDNFLKERLDLDELNVILFTPPKPTELNVFVEEGKMFLRIDVKRFYSFFDDERELELKHLLYQLVGLPRIESNLKRVARTLNKWRNELTDTEFFSIFGAYDSRMVRNGVCFGVLVNNPNYAKLYYNINFEELASSSTDLLVWKNDYLFHFVVGLLVSSWPSYSMAGRVTKNQEIVKLGVSSKNELNYALKAMSHELVRREVMGIGEEMDNESLYEDDFAPSFDGKINYFNTADYVLESFLKIKSKLKQSYSPGLEKLKEQFEPWRITFLEGLKKSPEEERKEVILEIMKREKRMVPGKLYMLTSYGREEVLETLLELEKEGKVKRDRLGLFWEYVETRNK